MPRENYAKLGNGFYTVRTQAGLRQAIKSFWGRGEEFPEVANYVVVYPALVALSIGYNGGNYVHVQSLPFNIVLKAIATSDKSGEPDDDQVDARSGDAQAVAGCAGPD